MHFKFYVELYFILTTLYFGPYLSLYTSAVKTRCSNSEKMFLKVPYNSSSVNKSKVHLNKCFSHDILNLWNDLPLEI